MPDTVTFHFEGRTLTVPRGATIGAALWAAGIRQWRRTRVAGQPRALFCGIGHCFDCLVRVGDGPPVRACVTPAGNGDNVRAGDVP
jgi:D-hydroxyproline dehydrogenase subunit alpha